MLRASGEFTRLVQTTWLRLRVEPALCDAVGEGGSAPSTTTAGGLMIEPKLANEDDASDGALAAAGIPGSAPVERGPKWRSASADGADKRWLLSVLSEISEPTHGFTLNLAQRPRQRYMTTEPASTRAKGTTIQ
jgi:hypothetical protein